MTQSDETMICSAVEGYWHVPTLIVRLHDLIMCWYVCPQRLMGAHKSISCRKVSGELV
jgi:hypothetical protein